MPILNIERPSIKPGAVRKLQFDNGCTMRRDRDCGTGFRVRVKLPTGEQRHLDAAWIAILALPKTLQPMKTEPGLARGLRIEQDERARRQAYKAAKKKM